MLIGNGVCCVVVNFFGFGGMNVSVLVEWYEFVYKYCGVKRLRFCEDVV